MKRWFVSRDRISSLFMNGMLFRWQVTYEQRFFARVTLRAITSQHISSNFNSENIIVGVATVLQLCKSPPGELP